MLEHTTLPEEPKPSPTPPSTDTFAQRTAYITVTIAQCGTGLSHVRPWDRGLLPLSERLVYKCALPSEEASLRQEQAKTVSGGFGLMEMQLSNKAVVLNPGHTLSNRRSFYTSQRPVSTPDELNRNWWGETQKLVFRMPQYSAKAESQWLGAILALGQ